MTTNMNWYPVARSGDVPPRHVFHGELHGIELALWRTDGGDINAWENRCPHRSVRFTLGTNDGATLRCQYHGWRYRHGDGRCVEVPASLAGSTPPHACARPFAIAEAGGYVWVSIDAAPGARPAALPFEPLAAVLRSVVVHANEASVRAALKLYAELDTSFQPGTSSVVARGPMLEVGWQSHTSGPQRVRFAIQPAGGARTVIHPSTDRVVVDGEAAARWHNRHLTLLRRRVESAPQPVAAEPRYIPIVPTPGDLGRARAPALFAATVIERRQTAEDIVALRLALPAEVELAFEPGAHVDVHTPAGLVRQYSLVNAPNERRELVLGVKREAQSRGGSQSIHERLQAGDRVTVSTPKNHFSLSRANGACRSQAVSALRRCWRWRRRCKLRGGRTSCTISRVARRMSRLPSGSAGLMPLSVISAWIPRRRGLRLGTGLPRCPLAMTSISAGRAR